MAQHKNPETAFEVLASAGNRAAVLTGAGSIVIENRALPIPGPLEVLIRVTAVGVCGSDVHYYQHGRIGDAIVEEPMILGHEAAGTVVAVGELVTKHSVGDRVAIEPGVPCGRCRECRAGRYNLCPDVVFMATPPIDGAFTNFVAWHEDFVFGLPDNLSDQAGAMIEPLSVGVWSCRRAGVTAGDRVLITGAGPVGLLTLQVARAFGATQIEISDVNEARLSLAGKLGATRRIVSGHGDFSEADVFIDCSGHPGAITAGIEALRPAGVAILVGLGPKSTAELPVNLIQRREIWVSGVFRYANTYPTAIALASQGVVDVESIITGTFPLDDAEAAVRAGLDSPDSVKAIVRP